MLPYNHANLEISPDIHDREAIAPGSTETDTTKLLALANEHAAPDGPWLDIACGSGRHVHALIKSKRDAYGIDIDPRMVDAARERLSDIHDTKQRVLVADASDQCAWRALPHRQFAVITLCNRSLACFHSHQQAWGLFTAVSAHLAPGGLWLIDNCCTPLWDQVKEGYFADGCSDAGDEQLIFLRGENRFTWRRGDEVDATDWHIRESDRIFRLWSLGEIALAASGTGLAISTLRADTTWIVLTKPGPDPS